VVDTAGEVCPGLVEVSRLARHVREPGFYGGTWSHGGDGKRKR
jgi:hypothetical protein